MGQLVNPLVSTATVLISCNLNMKTGACVAAFILLRLLLVVAQDDYCVSTDDYGCTGDFDCCEPGDTCGGVAGQCINIDARREQYEYEYEEGQVEEEGGDDYEYEEVAPCIDEPGCEKDSDCCEGTCEVGSCVMLG